MFERLRDRLGTKATAVAVATVLLGGGVALALPDAAITGQETAAANQEAAEAKALAAQETAESNRAAATDVAGTDVADMMADIRSIDDLDANEIPGERVPDEVRTYLNDLWDWLGCIQDGARAHGEQQSNADTRVEDDEYDDADKLALCDEKPTNRNDEGGEIESEGEGRPDFAGGPPPWVADLEDGGPPPHADR